MEQTVLIIGWVIRSNPTKPFWTREFRKKYSKLLHIHGNTFSSKTWMEMEKFREVVEDLKRLIRRGRHPKYGDYAEVKMCLFHRCGGLTKASIWGDSEAVETEYHLPTHYIYATDAIHLGCGNKWDECDVAMMPNQLQGGEKDGTDSN